MPISSSGDLTTASGLRGRSRSLAHGDRLLDGELYAPGPRLDWRALLKRTLDLVLVLRKFRGVRNPIAVRFLK